MNFISNAYGALSCVLLALSVIGILASTFLPAEKRKKLLCHLVRTWIM
jgi:hypothetical protein